MAARRRFPLVDSLRAVAALSVVVFHAVGYWAGGLSSPDVRHVLARLDVGVVVFLLISGFVLYRPYAEAAHRGIAHQPLRVYTWHRFLRIVPAYWVALVLCAIALSLPGVLSLHGVATYFGFGQIYSAQTLGGGIAPAWTLGLEVSFYALLPLYVRLMRRVRAEVLGVAAIFAFSMAYKVALFATGAVSRPGTGPMSALVILPGYLDEFALGMGLAVLSVRLDGATAPAPLRTLARRPGLGWLFAAGALLVAAYGIGVTGDPAQRFTAAQYLLRNVLYGAVGVGLLAPAVFGTEAAVGVRRVMAWRPLLWLGAVSYGIYIWHWPILMQLSRWGLSDVRGVHQYLLWGVCGVVLAVAFGGASFYLIERPALSLRHRFAGRPARAAP